MKVSSLAIGLAAIAVGVSAVPTANPESAVALIPQRDVCGFAKTLRSPDMEFVEGTWKMMVKREEKREEDSTDSTDGEEICCFYFSPLSWKAKRESAAISFSDWADKRDVLSPEAFKMHKIRDEVLERAPTASMDMSPRDLGIFVDALVKRFGVC